jgi:hypothetical protein
VSAREYADDCPCFLIDATRKYGYYISKCAMPAPLAEESVGGVESELEIKNTLQFALT